MAIFALVVIGALVAGTFFAGRLEQQGGRNTLYATQAFEAADAGLATSLAGWDGAWNTLAVRDSVQVTMTELGSSTGIFSGATVVKINDNSFMVRGEGERRAPNGTVLGRRTVAMLTKMFITDVPVRAALVARGDLEVRGTADLYGDNLDPPGWASSSTNRAACPFDDTEVPAAEVSGTISTNGNPTMEPAPVENSADLTDSLFLEPFDALTQMANIVLTGSGTISMSPTPTATTTTPVRCNTAFSSNWGEPELSVDACKGYFPIIYSPTNLRLTTGRGQGILLVDGDLTLAGNFTFAGIIITRGSFNASHGTNNVYGTVLANNALLEDQTMAGTPQVQFSTCAVSRALTASARAVPFNSRAWAQLY